MRLVFLLCLVPTLAFGDCPAVPERSATHIDLMAQVSRSTNEMESRALTNQLWQIWATAPDATAQEILQRGMERRRAFDLLGAIEDFDALIAYCPDYAEGYNQRAFAQFIRQDYLASLTDLDLALERMPDHIAALTGKALALMQLGREHDGQIALRQALALNPWLPERNRLKPLETDEPQEKEL